MQAPLAERPTVTLDSRGVPHKLKLAGCAAQGSINQGRALFHQGVMSSTDEHPLR